MSQLKTVTSPASNSDINNTAGFNILHENKTTQHEKSVVILCVWGLVVFSKLSSKYPSIRSFSIPLILPRVAREPGTYPTRGTRRGTPWTGCQPIEGHNCVHNNTLRTNANQSTTHVFGVGEETGVPGGNP